MLRIAFVCAFFVTTTVGLQVQSNLNGYWKKFKSTHGKRYTGEEEAMRKTIFKKNVEEILIHNLRKDIGEVSYTQGINEFSDMEHKEFVEIMCGLPASWNDTIDGEVMIPRSQVNVPDSLDWRTLGAVTPVKNQGFCGSCWAYAAIGTIEGAWFKNHKELVVLSEQNLLDCSSNKKYRNQGCDGGWPNRAMQYVIDNGGVNEDRCYRYQGMVGKCAYNSTCKNVKITKVVKIPRANEDALLEAVSNNGPISVCLSASNRDFINYRSGVYSPSSCSQTVDHAVILVGYGTENEKPYWLIKNSWGQSWGDRGYMKLVRNEGNMCEIATSASYAVAA